MKQATAAEGGGSTAADAAGATTTASGSTPAAGAQPAAPAGPNSTTTSAGGPLANPASSVAAASGSAVTAGGKASAMPPSPNLPQQNHCWLPTWLNSPTQGGGGVGQFPGQHPGQKPGQVPGSTTKPPHPPHPPKPPKPGTTPGGTKPTDPKPDPVDPKPTDPKPDPVDPKPDPVDPKPDPVDPKPDPDPVDPTDPVGPVDPVDPKPNAGRVDKYEVKSIDVKGNGGGQADDAGHLFVSSGTEVKILDRNQKQIGSIPVPQGAVDVAPAPDGKSAFVVSVVGNKYLPQKYVKGADGSWSKDANFKLEPFEYGGRMHDAEGMRIATDAKGNLFVADGVWSSNSLNTVVKFSPEGKYITRFGEYVEGNPGDKSSWEQGKFYWSLGGIAVSRDGNTVYTTEVGNNRVQKWDLQENGTYRSTKMWGNTQENDPDRKGDSTPGKFAAPYDIGLDQWGDVYVMNTTVSQIQKFTPDGEWILSMNVGRKAPVMTEGERSHGMAVDALGNAISTETGMVMRRTEAETRDVPPMRETPKPDHVAPTLKGFTLPEFADSATVTISIDAEDDRKPTEVRTALEDGTWGPWKPYSKDLEVTLSDGVGVKGIAVQVRDAAGNESDSVYHTLLRRA